MNTSVGQQPKEITFSTEGATAFKDASLKSNPRYIQRLAQLRKMKVKRKRLNSIARLKSHPRNRLMRKSGRAASSSNIPYAHNKSAPESITSSKPKPTINQTTKNHTTNFSTITLTSFVSFFFGAMLTVLLITYTQFNALPIFTDNAKWQSMYPGDLFVVIILVYFVGGALKGLAGLGMALISVPIIGLLYDPVLAATIVSIPLIVSNVRQGLFSGKLTHTVRNYMPFLASMSVVMGPTVYFSTLLPINYISVLLGLLAITYALMNLGFKLPTIPDSKDYWAQLIFGSAAGIAGGLSGLIAIPLAFYVISRNIEKLTAVSVMGLAFLISGIALLAGHLSNGNLSQQLLFISVLATIPGLAGTLVGEVFRNKVNTQVFRKIVLIVVLLIGVKILISQLSPG